MWIWRRIKSIGWTGREANGEVLNINMIRCWQWNCLGHSLRGDSMLRTAIGRTPSGGGNDDGDGDGDYDDNEDNGWWCRIKWCDAILLCQVDLEFRRQWDKLVISLDVIDREDESGSEAVHWITHYPVRRRRKCWSDFLLSVIYLCIPMCNKYIADFDWWLDLTGHSVSCVPYYGHLLGCTIVQVR